ncbi:hypothetical protein SKAU_G00392710 [Synaphobranchus kaupii]|uniref:Microtubule associated tumor suppressor 1 n=1 Tax=Synaphobranchus kaupii TaxID=118154 RepID=A0A9Q1EBS3_SYNKA|nr:hypothetical protein SKAU_G00392710 [Synaphobranchus kaupii]
MMSEFLSQTCTYQLKELNCSQHLALSGSDQDGAEFYYASGVFPPDGPQNSNVLSYKSSEGILEMEMAGSGAVSESPTQTCTEGSYSNPEDCPVGLRSGKPLNEGSVFAGPRCPVSTEAAGGTGVAVTSTDPSGTAWSEASLLSQGPGSTIRTSSPAQDSSRKTAHVQLTCERRAVRPPQERRWTPGGGARGEPPMDKPAKAGVKALPKPDVKKSKSKGQPRPAASMRVSRLAQLKMSAKENTKIKSPKEGSPSEPLKRSSVTPSKAAKEPQGQRLFGGGVRGEPAGPSPAPSLAPAVTRRLARPVARLRPDSSGKDGHSAGLKPAVPETTPAASAVIFKASEKPAPSAVSGSPPVLGGVPSSRAGGVRNRAATLPGKSGIGYKTTAVHEGAFSRPTPSPLQLASARLVRPAGALPVDRTKKRPGPRSQPSPGRPQPGPPPREGRTPRAPSQDVQQLRSLLVAGGRRFEAVAVVMQQILAERDEALNRCTVLSQELVALQEQLVTSATSCDKLDKEKDELRAAFEGVLRKAQERHHSDLAELEEQLGAFYSAEWEKVHHAYQQEADRYRSCIQQQVNDLRLKHETLEKEMRTSHSEKVESLNRHYETSFEELKNSQDQERETHKQSLKEMETTLSERIQGLARENAALYEKLSAEEESRRLLAEESQDSRTLYLQQELESLKVVLELKSTEFHQQNKKLMELKTLRETNLNLDGRLRKTEQENEDLRARLDEHTALHRQLSTEQVALQQTIMKETKVNNRLSLQNEELLWKLHNGDLWGPRNLPPPSPSFQSSRNSGSFSSTPLSSS